MKDLPIKDLLLVILVIFDLIIIIILVYLYIKFKKILTFPWEEFERSLERAQGLVDKLRDLSSSHEKAIVREKAGDLEERVIENYQEGLSIREIAKKVGLSAGEVEIILKKRGVL